MLVCLHSCHLVVWQKLTNKISTRLTENEFCGQFVELKAVTTVKQRIKEYNTEDKDEEKHTQDMF